MEDAWVGRATQRRRGARCMRGRRADEVQGLGDGRTHACALRSCEGCFTVRGEWSVVCGILGARKLSPWWVRGGDDRWLGLGGTSNEL